MNLDLRNVLEAATRGDERSQLPRWSAKLVIVLHRVMEKMTLEDLFLQLPKRDALLRLENKNQIK